MPKSHASSRPARGAEAAPLAEGALERLRRDLLRGGAVAQQGGDVAVDAREGAAVERLERLGRGGAAALEGAGNPFRNCFAHTSTTLGPAFHHGRVPRSRTSARAGSAGARGGIRRRRPLGDDQHLRHRGEPERRSACGRACPATGPGRRCGCASGRPTTTAPRRPGTTWAETASSPWIKVGDARSARAPGGAQVPHRPAAADHEPRGARRGRVPVAAAQSGEVVRREQRVTLSGHPTGSHGDPCDYSAGLCEIKFPLGVRPVEKARVVRDHAVHAHRLEAGDLVGVVHRPHVELAAGRADQLARGAA